MNTKVAFVVYGVHKDGLNDPMGTPFIDDALTLRSKAALRAAGLELVEYETVIASREEARECLGMFRKMDGIDALVLFSGTWVWAAHLIAAVRDFAKTGKGIVIWTHPGSQGWRPVGGLVMQAALKETGIPHRFVYGAADSPRDIERVTAYCRASAMRCRLDGAVMGSFGGRGMGQTCGTADPSQWMKTFGIDLDSRDTRDLVETAEKVTAEELAAARGKIRPLFSVPIPEDETADRSIRLYLAIRKVLAKEKWQYYTIQSFPGLGDYYSATCFAQSLMLDEGWGTSTLSDFNTALTVTLLNTLSDEPVYYGDLQHIDKESGEIKIIGDGACPPSLAGAVGPAKFAQHGIPTEGEAGGLSVDLVCKPGKGVLARIGRVDGQFQMALTRCTVFEPDADELESRRLECGIPFWPHAFVKAECDIERLLDSWNNEYAVLGYGEHLYEELAAFCEQTGIACLAL